MELVAAAGQGMSREPRRLPIADTAPDPGIFGPGSITWEVMREPVLILGGGRALLMQAAHPLVAQGAIDHSDYSTDPFGRLDRTLRWVVSVTYGTSREARAASRAVNRLHAAVSGALPTRSATERVGAGTVYTARDPDLLLWVHATFVDTMLTTHDALVGTLTEADRDGFVREWHAVARLMGVAPRLLWSDAAGLRDYIEEAVARGPVRPGPGSRHVARTVVRPPLPSSALRPMWDAIAFTTVGLLPARVRRGYGFLWTPAHDAAHLGMRVWLRQTRSILPERFRTSPVYEFAQRRVRGDLDGATPRRPRPAARRRPPRRAASRADPSPLGDHGRGQPLNLARMPSRMARPSSPARSAASQSSTPPPTRRRGTPRPRRRTRRGARGRRGGPRPRRSRGGRRGCARRGSPRCRAA